MSHPLPGAGVRALAAAALCSAVCAVVDGGAVHASGSWQQGHCDAGERQDDCASEAPAPGGARQALLQTDSMPRRIVSVGSSLSQIKRVVWSSLRPDLRDQGDAPAEPYQATGRDPLEDKLSDAGLEREAPPARTHLASFVAFDTDTGRARFLWAASLACTGVVALAWSFRHALEKHVLRGLPHCLTWLCCCSMMVLCIAWIFDRRCGNFPFPLTLTAWHLLACTFSTWTVRWLAPAKVSGALMPALGEYESDLALLRVALPAVLLIGVLQAGNMAMGMFSYTIASVTLLQMVQVFVGPMTACISAFAIGTEAASAELFGIMLVISLGALLMVYKEASVVPMAIALQAVATWLENLRLQGLQVMVRGGALHSRLDSLTVLYLCSPVALVCMVFVAASSEWWVEGWAVWDRAWALGWLLLLDAAGAVAVAVATVAAVERASALTVGIVAVLKDCFLMWCDAMVFGTRILPVQAVGLLITVSGMVLYRRYCVAPKESPEIAPEDEAPEDKVDAVAKAGAKDDAASNPELAPEQEGHARVLASAFTKSYPESAPEEEAETSGHAGREQPDERARDPEIVLCDGAKG